MDIALGGRGFDDFIGDESFGVLGVVAASGRALFGLGNRRSEGFPHFEGHQAAERIFFGNEDIACLVHPAGAVSERGLAETPERVCGPGNFFVDLGIGESVKFLDEFTRSWIDGGDGHSGSSVRGSGRKLLHSAQTIFYSETLLFCSKDFA